VRFCFQGKIAIAVKNSDRGSELLPQEKVMGLVPRKLCLPLIRGRIPAEGWDIGMEHSGFFP